MTSDQAMIYVVDDDAGSRQSVKALVRSMGLQAVACSSAEEFLTELDPDRPGCLVTDVRMPGMSGIELQERLVAERISLPVIIITAYAETPLTVKALKQGAVTVLEKPCRDYELYDSIRDALARDADKRSQLAKQQKFQKALNALTDAERAVLDLMLEGAANKLIARQLDVSVRTVENRRQKIFEKTDSRNLAELLRRCFRSSLDNS